MPRDAVTWAVLATDGAAQFIDHVSHSQDWPAIAQMNAGELGTLLACDEWEVASYSNGRHLPRAKRHDDKTVVATPVLW